LARSKTRTCSNPHHRAPESASMCSGKLVEAKPLVKMKNSRNGVGESGEAWPHITDVCQDSIRPLSIWFPVHCTYNPAFSCASALRDPNLKGTFYMCSFFFQSLYSTDESP